MSRVEKAQEPSMEDILASIRKIISEEPIGSRPPPAQAGPQKPMAAPMPQAVVARKPAEAVALDDVLSLADDVPTGRYVPASTATPPAGTPSADAPPSWLFPRPAQAGPATGNGAAGPPLPAADGLARPGSAPLPAPFFNGPAAQAVDKSTPASPAQPAAAHSGPPKSSAPVPAQVVTAARNGNGYGDLGAVVPSRPNEIRAQVPPASQPAPQMAAAAELSPAVTKRPAPAAPAPAVTKPAPGPAAAKPAPSVGVPQPSDHVKPQQPVAAAKPETRLPIAAEPTKPAPALAELAGPARDATPAPAAAQAAPAATKPATTLTSEPTAAEGPAPVLLGTPLPAPVPLTKANAQVVVPSASQAAALTSIEERIVELLRPMVREWLDQHMPRMLEKALSIELAASVKPKAQPPKG